KYFVLRVSGLYGMNLCRAKGGHNFVTLMLKLAKEREILTPTYGVLSEKTYLRVKINFIDNSAKPTFG
ncbi:MAG: hypothetical protein U9O82_00765, partial [Thermodesulfobacteriota bacterium]|nr:hypothetical protein [Thermodesulfobacteriota bacterium]